MTNPPLSTAEVGGNIWTPETRRPGWRIVLRIRVIYTRACFGRDGDEHREVGGQNVGSLAVVLADLVLV